MEREDREIIESERERARERARERELESESKKGHREREREREPCDLQNKHSTHTVQFLMPVPYSFDRVC